MKVAMLLISMLFLATAVEARPGGGGRLLAKKSKKEPSCRKGCKQACEAMEAPCSKGQKACKKTCKKDKRKESCEVLGLKGKACKKEKKANKLASCKAELEDCNKKSKKSKKNKCKAGICKKKPCKKTSACPK